MKKLIYLTLLIHILCAMAFSAVRTISYDCKNLITINPQLTEEKGAYAIKEILPQGLTPFHITQNGIWDPNEHSIIWGAFPDTINRQVSYQVNGLEKEYSLDGQISINGVSQDILGDQTFTIQTCPLNLLTIQPKAGQLSLGYFYQVSIQGGIYPYEFSIIQGSLPTGISLDLSEGTLSGTPSQTGTFDFTLQVEDAEGQRFQKVYFIEVTDPLVLLTAPLINVSQNTELNFLLMSDGGKPPYIYSLISGDLPPGLTLHANGEMNGTCAETGRFQLTIQIEDANTNVIEADLTMHVLDPNAYGTASRSIDTSNCNNRVTIQTTFPSDKGGYAIREVLPDGLTASNISHNGVYDPNENTIIWGAYADKTNRTFSYRVSGAIQEYLLDGLISIDGLSLNISGDQHVALNFCPPNIITQFLDPAQKTVNYEFQILMEGGSPPFSFYVAYGILPPGLSVNPETGMISGVPTATGAKTFFLACKDQDNMEVDREFTLEVTEKLEFVSTSTLPHATQNLDYFTAILSTGGKPDFTYSHVSGELPQGIALSDNGVLSGQISNIGNYSFVIGVTDMNENEIQKTFTLLVCPPLSLENERLANAIIGSDYNLSLTADGGFGSYQWQVYSGMLPSGLQLNPATGIISGIPQQPVYSTLVFSVSDEDNRKVFKDFTFQAALPLTFASDQLPNALKNEQYSERIRITGGIGPYEFTIQGLIPEGMTFDTSTGTLSGKSTIGGSTNIYVTVTDSTWPNAQTIGQYLKLRTTSMLTILTSAVLPRARRGQEINPVYLEAGGVSSSYTWKISEGRLPNGITLDSETGVLSGKPLDRGDFVMHIQVTETNHQHAEKEFIWHITDTLRISTGILADAAENASYNFSLQAEGGLPPYQWRLKNTQLPQGLALNTETGAIYGKPMSQSTQSIVVEVSDNDSPPQVIQKEFHLEVLPKALYIFTPELPDCPVNTSYIAEIKAFLGKPPYTWAHKSGILPPGLTMHSSPSLATLEGTPEETGVYTFTLSVSDQSMPANHAEKTFTVAIAGSLEFITRELTQAQSGELYHANVRAMGGQPPYTFQLLNGNLPIGLELNAITGDISGTPDDIMGESKEFTIQVKDSANPPATEERTFTIYVIEPVQIITEVIPDALQYRRYVTDLEVSGGIQPYTFEISSGVLPKGIKFDSLWGILSGFPSETGTFSFTVRLTDNGTPPVNRSKFFEMQVYPGQPPIVIGGDLDANEQVGLSDLVIALQALTNFRGVPVFMEADFNNNRRVDLIDALMIMDACAHSR